MMLVIQLYTNSGRKANKAAFIHTQISAYTYIYMYTLYIFKGHAQMWKNIKNF